MAALTTAGRRSVRRMSMQAPRRRRLSQANVDNKTLASGTTALDRDADWRPLYRIGAAAALAAVMFAVAQMAIEAVGLLTLGASGQPPHDAAGWFAMLRSYPLLGLTELTAFQIPVFALLAPVLLALCLALGRARRGYAVACATVALVGIVVYLASNTALPMLVLSNQYAAAGSDAERAQLLAAGRAMLATYEGSGVDVGLPMVCAGVLMMSVLMLRSPIFNRATAIAGILSGVTELGYYASLAVPGMGILLLEISGVMLLVWLALAARELLQASSGR